MKNLLKGAISAIGVIAVCAACSLDKIVKVDKPLVGTEVDHDYLDTRAGALALLNSTVGSLQKAVSSASLEVSLFTDELLSRPARTPEYQWSFGTSADTRFESIDYYGVKGLQLTAYTGLQSARVQAGYARYFLRRRADSTLNYAISAAYSFEGYAITMLAENLCSGVPLSESQYGQPAVYGVGLSTDSLLKVAVAKFDSAIAIPHDSLRFATLAKIGKARALMSLGLYADAAQAVAGIAQSDAYNLYYTESLTPNPSASTPVAENAFWPIPSSIGTPGMYDGHEIVNREGNNGLIWFVNPAAIDPRVPVTVTTTDGIATFPSVVRETKFPDGNAVFQLAGWVEAKMVEAEHLLSVGDPGWINAINAARSTVGLPDTTAPATVDQKVNLLFRERAFWFYGQATRLADMRRLVRQYHRHVNTVFPVGQYSRSDKVYSYGDATVFIPNSAEFKDNYKYSGCINRKP